MNFIIEWVDALWLIVLFLVVHKQQRFWTVAFVVCSMIMMRLLAELMVHIGYPRGFLPLLEAHVFIRGLLVYSVTYILYAIMAYYSPDTKGVIFIASSISLFFIAATICIGVMVL